MARTPRLGAAVATLALPVAATLTACGSSVSPDAVRSTLATLPAQETPTSSTAAPAPSARTTSAPRLTAPEAPSTVPVASEATTTPPAPAPAPTTTGAAVTTAAATTTAPGSRIRYVAEPATGALQLGHHGERVRSLQGQLVALGFVVGVDSYFGRDTEQAVQAFQRQQGLPADGIAAQPTLDRLAQLAVVP